MPTFYKTKSRKSAVLPHRTFVGRSMSRPAVRKKPALHVAKKVDESVEEVKSGATLHERASTTITSLNELLARKTNEEKHLTDEEVTGDNAVFEDESVVDAFDGVSDLDEQEQLYDTAIDYERKKTKVVSEQIKLIEEEREKEKRALENEIKELRRELHRTAPLHDTKFFSLSKELKEAISEIEKVAGPLPKTITLPTEPKEVPLAAESFKSPGIPPEATLVEPKVVAKPTVADTTTPLPPGNEDNPEIEQMQKKLPKKKMLITGASAIALFIVVSNVVSGNLGSQASVDKKIVDSYLTSQTGQVQGVQTTAEASSSQNQESDPSQSDITFEQCVWEEFNDPSFGIMLQYPKNAVKAIRTDSNVTFVRKTGYLFKIQRIETSLSLDDYWAQIKPTSLNFAVGPDTFKGKPSLKLTLEDLTDYPGDRIMVKEGGFIYDVWFATPSKSFTQDDMKRVEKMLASLSIVGAK